MTDSTRTTGPAPPGGTTPRAGVARAFLPVQPGELATVALAALYFYLVLTSYYVLRPVRETMGIERGYDNLPWLMTGTLGAMLLATPAFGALVSRLPRRRFIPLVYGFFVLNLLVFFGLFRALPPESRTALGYAFYIWLSVFNLFVVSIFWAVATDVFSHDQGRRLFGFIAVGGTVGAMTGAALTQRLAGAVGPAGLMLVAAGVLSASAACAVVLLRRTGGARAACPSCGATRGTEVGTVCARCGASGPMPVPTRPDRAPAARAAGQAQPAAGSREPGPGALRGVALVARSPYLLALCLYMFLFTTTSTFLYLEQGRIIEESFPDRAARTVAFARLDLWTNALTLVTQLVITGQLMRRLGVRTALGVLPVLTLAGFGALAAFPAYGTLGAFQVLRRGLHYAIDRPAREVLYTIVGPDERYKSKSFIDTFVYRAGDMVGGWTGKLLGALPAALGEAALAPAVFGAAAITVSGAWVACALVLGRLYARRLRTPAP